MKKKHGAASLLTTQLDDFGEFMSEPFVEVLKNIAAEIITETRNQDTYIVNHKDYWET